MYNFFNFEENAQKTIEWFSAEISKLRTGRASPQIVEDIRADYYGVLTPIKNMASISVSDPKTLTIQPWDKNSIPAIEKAVMQANFGINPVADKDVVHLRLPELTGERREMLIKTVKEKLEEAKVTLRKLRSEIWEDIQDQEKEKKISEDDKFRHKDELQKKIDEFQKKLDEIADRKIGEIQI